MSKDKDGSLLVPSQSIFPFLDLPVEIRNIIYSFVLNCGKASSIERRRNLEIRNRTAIMSASRQIYLEARSVLYAQMIFPYLSNFHDALLRMGPTNRSLLKSIRVNGGANQCAKSRLLAQSCMLLQDAAKSLNTFHINYCFRELGVTSACWNADDLARRFYQDTYQLLESIGSARGSHDAALEVFQFNAINLINYDIHDYITGRPGESITSLEKKRRETEFRGKLARKLLNCQSPYT